QRRERPVRFLLAWLVPCWIVLELVITKLPHYVLPLYPAIAILIARTLRDGALSERPWLKRGALWWPAIAIIIPIAGIVALGIMRYKLGLLAWPCGAAAMVFGFMAWRYYADDGADVSLVRAVVATVLIMIAVLGVITPSLRPLFPSATIARALQAHDCDYKVVASAGYHEPSLVFLVGTNTQLTDGAGAAEALRGGGGYCRFALVEAREQRAFAQRAEALGLRYAPGPRIEGININNGRQVAITIYRASQIP